MNTIIITLLSFFLFQVCISDVVPITKPLDIREVTQQVIYSFASYCKDLVSIQNWTCFWCLGGQEKDPLKIVQMAYAAQTDTFAYIGISIPLPSNKDPNPKIYVVFRGTQKGSITNWMDDLDIIPVSPGWSDHPFVYVHQGFLDSWLAVRSTVMQGIQKALNMSPGSDILFTGHSLGGSIATLAAIDYYRTKNVMPKLMTFGSPRVGNYFFYKYYQETEIPSIRVVNQEDPVPHLPFELDGLYHHINLEYWFVNATSGVYKQCDESGEDPACSISVNIENWKVADHSNYSTIDLTSGAQFNCAMNVNMTRYL